MKEVITPIDIGLIDKELTPDKFLRDTNNGGNQLYIINHHNSPNIMREVGRLRELTFRNAGGGTGKEILGGYRFHICSNESDPDNLATSKLFTFSDEFSKTYLPYMIELGRSFIQPKFQSKAAGRKGLFALDNLWDGLGALVVENPQTKHFFGKVTMYPHFNTEARNIILYFLQTQFPDDKNMVEAKNPIPLHIDEQKMKQLFNGKNYKENYRILQKKIREFDLNIPPLINAYMNFRIFFWRI